MKPLIGGLERIDSSDNITKWLAMQ